MKKYRNLTIVLCLVILFLVFYARQAGELGRVGQFRVFVSNLKSVNAQLVGVDVDNRKIASIDLSKTKLNIERIKEIFDFSIYSVQRVTLPDSLTFDEVNEFRNSFSDVHLVGQTNETKTVD